MGAQLGQRHALPGELIEQRRRGAAILLVSEDLDEIMALSDRIAVIYEGEIAGEMPAVEATPEKLGLWMGGGARQENP